MNRFKKLLSLLLLPRLLSRSCADRIPRSGPAGEAVNCFALSIDKGTEPYLLIFAMTGSKLTGRQWDGSSYSQPVTAALDDINPDDLLVRHYYGLDEILYTGIIDLAWGRLTGLPYLKLYLRRFGQYRFNRQKLVTKRRMDLLSFLLNRQLESAAAIHENVRFNPWKIMTALYSERWLPHPEGFAQWQVVRFYLDSLAETGDLKKIADDYQITAQAIKTLEDYEEQERKHAESVNLQRGAFWLSFAVFLLAVVQAGLVKLPALIDFSGWRSPFTYPASTTSISTSSPVTNPPPSAGAGSAAPAAGGD